jgi:alpha-D-ribose 1-methylphosphonate 5-triphosphate synthase subunit PhnH
MSAAASRAADALRGGFSDPVFDAQSVFRQVMNAFARPGTVCGFGNLATPPAPLSPCVGAIAATLFDHDTNIWLDPLLAGQETVTGWLTFQTAAPILSRAIDAQFAIIGNGAALPPLEEFAQGTQEYPDRSTTVILQVQSLFAGLPLMLTGPGIKDRTPIAPQGLPANFFDQWDANRRRFPRGVDLILAAPDGVIGLPRTTEISSREGV